MGVIISCNWGPLDKLMRLSGIECGAVPESKVRFLSAAPVRTLGSGALGGPTCAPGSLSRRRPRHGLFFLQETDYSCDFVSGKVLV